MNYRPTYAMAFASALALVMALGTAKPAAAADMIGKCELTGTKGAIPINPAIPGQLHVEVNLPAPGWWNGDTPDSIADGYEYCMSANIAYRAGLGKVKVVNVAWDALVAPWKSNRPASVFKPAGCLECRMTGYQGRIGIYEILLMTPGLRKLIVPGADLARIRELAYREGMKPLRISGALKVVAGLTTLEEVLRTAPSPSQG